MVKVFIATPCYSGKVNVQYALSLADTKLELYQSGIEVQFYLTVSGSLLVAERNKILMEFMKSDCTHLLCVDADLGWGSNSVKILIDHDVDFAAGIYPTRKGNMFLFRPICLPDGSILTHKNLLAMDYVPSGFMLMKKSVIEKMIEKFPETYYEPKVEGNNSKPGYCLFNTEVYDGEFWGEDYVFCRRARECGITIWVDPRITFDHDGTVGCMASILANKPKESQDEPNL